eukprot:14091615-Heterocapsa_arctica.AAC.1
MASGSGKAQSLSRQSAPAFAAQAQRTRGWVPHECWCGGRASGSAGGVGGELDERPARRRPTGRG